MANPPLHHMNQGNLPPIHPKDSPRGLKKWVLLTFLGVWLGYQIVFPLRFLLYPGNPSWTEEGHAFAWQMKLRDKKGKGIFIVRNPATQEEWSVYPKDYLMRHQVQKVMTRPDLIVQFAHYLAKRWQEIGGVPQPEVRARICVSLNGRKPALLIDPTRDLVKVTRNLNHADWILPLHEPFQHPPGRTRRRDLSC